MANIRGLRLQRNILIYSIMCVAAFHGIHCAEKESQLRRNENPILNTNNNHTTLMNRLEVKGDWNIVKGKLKQKFANLTENDLQYVEGQEDELVGRIQKRTGQTREAIERALRESGH